MFNLRQFVREQVDDLPGDLSTQDFAKTIATLIRGNDLRTALEQALVTYVRVELSLMRAQHRAPEPVADHKTNDAQAGLVGGTSSDLPAPATVPAKPKAGGPYREVYDATKQHYADAVHENPCVRCGPSGKPAPIGSPLSKGHIDARGRRAIMKEVLRQVWIESRRLHEAASRWPLPTPR